MSERRLSRLLVRLPVKKEVDEELSFHVAMRARELEQAGLTPAEARAEAERMFSGFHDVRTECIREGEKRERELSKAEYIAELGQDVRFAIRQSIRSRGFSAATALILALGIACVTLMFSVANAYLLRPLPYPNAERLVFVGEGAPSIDWREPQNVFSEVGAWDLDAFTLVGSGEPEQLLGSWVNAGFFRALGSKPARGRFLTDDDNRTGSPSVAVISHAVWRDRFAEDPHVIGRTFRAYSSDRPNEAETFTIVGVLPQDFWPFHPFTQVFAPLRGERAVTLALLRPGVTAAEAERVVTQIRARRAGADASPVSVVSMQERHVEQVRPKVFVLLGAVVLMLLIACANAAVLLLVRAGARAAEFSTRVALGAGKGRIARQLIVEGLVLALAAGALGVLLAQVGAKLLGPMIETRLGTAIPGGAAAVTIDWRVALAAFVLTGLCGCVFGLVPLFARARDRQAGLLLGLARSMTESRGRQRVRALLIASEVALSLALLSSAGLLVRSAWHLLRQDIGFDATNLFTANITMRHARYETTAQRVAFYDRLLARIRSEPGVTGATLAQTIPFGVVVRGAEGVESDAGAGVAPLQAVQQIVHSSYFQTMGITLVRGRGFEPTDREGAEPVAVVSEDFARRVWPNRDAIGQRVRTAKSEYEEASEWRRVIGIVRPVVNALRTEDPPEVYVSLSQYPSLLASVVLRAPGAESALTPALKRMVAQLDLEMPVTNAATMNTLLAEAHAQSTFLAWFLAGFAAFAVLLAVFGLYAVIAYTVEQERKAIAIRLVVGATMQDIIRLVVRRGVGITILGLVAGSALGLVLANELKRRLDSVQPISVPTFALAVILLGGAALLAMWVPARRAARTDPASALRR